jgi:hypothetical protein
MRDIFLTYDNPPKFTIKLNKLAGTVSQVFWRINGNEVDGTYSAVDLTGYTAECQLKIKNADDCEFGTDAELLTSFVLVQGNVKIKTIPIQTINNAWGFRLNIPPAVSSAFTWDKAVGVVFIVSPDGRREPFITLEFEPVRLAECYC